MVLLTLIDKNNFTDIGSCYFPKKGPGFSDEYELEEYLSQDQFMYLKQESVRFIYKDVSDEDVNNILEGNNVDSTTKNVITANTIHTKL